MSVRAFNGFTPKIGSSSWIAENAVVTGDVIMGEDCCLLFHAVIRGDVNSIRIGDGTNIQDGAIIHGSTGGIDTTIGDNVSIGHRAIVHGCTIHNNVLIGMGAIVLDNVVVNENVVVAAGAMVSGGSVLESGFIYAGVPAKKLKKLSPEAMTQYIDTIATGYKSLSKKYKDEGF